MVIIFCDFCHFYKILAFLSKTNLMINFLIKPTEYLVKNANLLLKFSAKILQKS
jgi:hypothetical protein